MTEVSIVIPTRNRDEEVKELLFSILEQTTPPIEVIVVDDSDNNKTRNLIEQIRANFLNKEITLKYRHGGEEERRSISLARNIGTAESSGKFVFFVDDDVILAKDYIENILEVYKEYPNAVGVQGYTKRLKGVSALSNALNKVLFQPYKEKDSCRVFAGAMTFANPLTRVIRCQWFSGEISTYKKEVLKDFKWDENLKRYSLCEDMDISYRIQKCYPNSLYATPYAEAVHKASPLGRTKTKRLIYMGVAYPTYFFLKNIKQTLLNRIIFVWSMFFGRFILTLLEKKPTSIVFLIGAYSNLLKHFEEIRNGNFASLETFETMKK